MASTDVRADGTQPRRGKIAGARPARIRARLAPSWERVQAGRAGQLVRRALDRYPPLPPAAEGIWPRVAFGLVVALVVAYTAFFAALLFTQQDAFMTHAEDMGIMDQALWNTTHGAVLHQTICDIITDTNCLGDVSRLGIHFEPILLPLALLYHFVPSPKTLQLIQAGVVAMGALPAYWLASRRLRSPMAGVAFAIAYLLFPALQAVVTYDFHAVAFAAAFLMFALYFMVDRNDAGLVIACLLALSTKEEIVVDVAMIGLSVALLQRRWRLGGGLVALSVVWLIGELLVMHAASPLGHSPTASRYAALGSGPVQAALFLIGHPVTVLQQYVFEPGHFYYLRTLLSPVAYLPILSPLSVLIAVPAIGINLLSNDSSMYSGLYQYNAEIVPVLIFAAIESAALLVTLAPAVARWLATAPAHQPDAAHSSPGRTARARAGWLRLRRTVAAAAHAPLARRARVMPVARVALIGITALTLFFSVYEQHTHGYTPLAEGFTWPQVTPHDRIGAQLVALIPPTATVSAQSDLVPHLSERRYIYMYPFGARRADYVFLDVTGSQYPLLATPDAYYRSVVDLLQSGADHVLAARDGYLLLAKGPGPALNPQDPYGLPASFYSFTQTTAAAVPHRLAVRFGSSLELVGYDVSPAATFYLRQSYLTVTTYWRVTGPVEGYPVAEIVRFDPSGAVYLESRSATAFWRPMAEWNPGAVMVVEATRIYLSGVDLGMMRLGVRVLSGLTAAGTPAPLAALPQGAPPAGTAVAGNGTIFIFAHELVHG